MPNHTVAFTTNAQTWTYTLALSDAGKIITVSAEGEITLTVPTNASVAFPVGTEIKIASLMSSVAVVKASGVTIRPYGATKYTVPAERVGTLIKMATDTWLIYGGTYSGNV